MDEHQDALERWGRFIAARPKRVILGWLVAAALVGSRARTGREHSSGVE